MSPQSLHGREAEQQRSDTPHQEYSSTDAIRDDALVIRNYDGRRSHEVTVRFIDADHEIAIDRSYRLSTGDAVSVVTGVDRGVYRVEAHMEDGEFVGTECLVGDGPDETAVVEVGNGLVSVSEGLV